LSDPACKEPDKSLPQAISFGSVIDGAIRRQQMIGKQVSHYRIVSQIGSGEMGRVYRAEDARLDRAVALKFLPDEYAENEQAL